MARIYITGHRNPDMDSVCSAFAYAKLKSSIDKENEYVPVMLGPANKSTKNFFRSLSLELPMVLRDVRPKVSDVQKSPVYSLSPADPVYYLIDLFANKKPTVVPVMDNGEYRGLLSVDDINSFFLRENRDDRVSYTLIEDNIPKVVSGFYLKKGRGEEIHAPFMVGAMEYDVFKKRLGKCKDKPVLVIGNRKKHLQTAVEQELPGIVLTGVENPMSLGFDFSSFPGFVYISRLDTAETLRLLRLSNPISDLLAVTRNTLEVSSEALFEEAKELLSRSEVRGLSVVSEGKWTGFVTRRCFLDKPRQKMILVDHNEIEQSVIGIEDSDIVEILDHHRLAAPRMRNPIYICSEPLGSTCTIVYEQYKKWGVEMDALTARVLLGGLVSDTVMLKSPTATDYDKHVAEKLCAIAKVDDFGAFCQQLFSSASSLADQNPRKVIESDMKKYHEFGVSFAIGQVEVTNLIQVDAIKTKYLEMLQSIKTAERLEWVMLMITDVMSESSILLTTGFEKERRFVFEKKGEDEYFMPGVLSRKKQLLPEVLRVLED
ncbi:MAG: putative manganese-dependent inorganic diphosphatase [Candidatus Ornithospirochaeta sp.]|nr:putative manganese-dependent inorganic diphosphatase [Candidatus Ornithospirochaeta sp.]